MPHNRQQETDALFRQLSGSLKEAFSGVTFRDHPLDPHFLVWTARDLTREEARKIPALHGNPAMPVRWEKLGTIGPQ